MNKTLGQRFLHIIEKEKEPNTSSSASNLPSISLNQLEKEVNEIKKKKYLKENSDDFTILNNKELNVCSPFYDRMKTHKENCKCPYHRKKQFEILPVRHTVKADMHMKKIGEKLEQSRSENRLQRFSNNEVRQFNKTKVINKSEDNIDESLIFPETQNFVFRPKMETRNLTYEMFLKECEFHLLRRKGFSTSKSSHVVRKGLKEIFEFINNHLDYSVEKMTEWINGIEKDKDYGEFYMERFREMKKNYELGLRKRKGKTFLDQDDLNKIPNGFEKVFNSTGNDFKSKQALNSFYDAHGKRYRSMNNGSLGTEEGMLGNDKNFLKSREGRNKEGRNSEDEYDSENEDKISEKYLNRILDDLREQNTISNEVFEDLMSLELNSFKHIFQTLQNNIINDKYSDEILLKLENGVLSELIKRSSAMSIKNSKDIRNPNDFKNLENTKDNQDNKNFKDLKDFKGLKSFKSLKDFRNEKNISSSKVISDLQEKLDIISKTQEVLKKHRSRLMSKVSNLSDRASFNETFTSKNFLGSKRNTSSIPNEENQKSVTGLHSKKSSNGDCSLVDSENNLNDSENDEKNIRPISKRKRRIQEEFEFDDENLTDAERKKLKALGFLGHHAKRSKLLKPGDEFLFLREGLEDDNKNDLEFRKQSIDLHRGYFTKAEKYLFELNMGKTIIKSDDSIFTAKRKMRVIKLLLKETPNAPEADALKNYVKQIEQKIFLKTQKNKKLMENRKTLEDEQIKDNEIWKSISLDNLGFELIFYNISSKFRTEDNDDLCILLNEWKLHNVRRLDNHLSFKMNLLTDDDEVRKSKKKTRIEDALIQEGMRNMEFETEMESNKEINDLNQSKMSATGKSFFNLNKNGKEEKMSGFFGEKLFTADDFEDIEEEELKMYEKKIREMFKYAKVHLPETFDRYIKNSPAVNYSQFSFDESQLMFDNFND